MSINVKFIEEALEQEGHNVIKCEKRLDDFVVEVLVKAENGKLYGYAIDSSQLAAGPPLNTVFVNAFKHIKP